jgi:uncharacterized protein YjiS (DUF1127 family)
MRTLTLTFPFPHVSARFLAQTGLEKSTDTLAIGFKALVSWQQRYNERRHLAELAPHLMADAGLTEAMRAQQISKPIWRA